MKVKIVGCKDNCGWYRELIGISFDVIKKENQTSRYYLTDENHFIQKYDCEVIEPDPVDTEAQDKSNRALKTGKFINGLNDHIAELTEENEALKKQSDKLLDDLNRYKSLYDIEQRKNASPLAEVSDLKKQLAEAKATALEYSNKYSDAEVERMLIRIQLEEAKAEISNANQKIGTLEEIIAEKNEDINAMINDRDENYLELQDKIEDRDIKIEALHKIIEKLGESL